MIGFVTWSPFLYYHSTKQKGYQVTKPIIVVKTMVYVNQAIEKILMDIFLALADITVFGCPYLQCASSWPHNFYTQGVFD